MYVLVEMIFGGYGRKTKVRGEVFFPCMQCSALNPFALVENYGYGQLYGVRLAKYKTNRMMLCAHCQHGYDLEKPQWDHAMAVANALKSSGYGNLTMHAMAESAVGLAQVCFPDMAGDLRALLWEQLGDPPPVDDGTSDVLEAAPAALEAPAAETKVCPDCAETVKAAARKCRFCGYIFGPEDALSPAAREVLAADPLTVEPDEQVVLTDGEGGSFGFRLLRVHDGLEPTTGAQPITGSRYFAVELEIENMVKDDDAWALITALLIDDTDRVREVAGADHEPAFDLVPELAPGATARGFMLFEVPLEVQPRYLRLGLDDSLAVAQWPLDTELAADAPLSPAPEPAA